MALIPLSLTFGLVIGLGFWVERLLANPLKGLFPGSTEIYRMGMGIAFFLVLVFCMGLLMKLWLVQRLFAWIEAQVASLPLVKTVYGAIKDVMNFLGGGNGQKGDMVVVLTLENGWRQLGIVTRQDFDELPPQLLAVPTQVAVYVPFSYQLGGFTYFVDRSQCEPVPGMAVEDAMRYAMMAWLGSSTPPAHKGDTVEAATPDASAVQKADDKSSADNNVGTGGNAV